MANPEHLAILKQGVEAWNQWRASAPEIAPDLTGADLAGADLNGADLRAANLAEANLTDTDLSGNPVGRTTLSNTRLADANFTKAKLWFADLGGADAPGANFDGADFSGATLVKTNLTGANLSRVRLHGANLCDTILHRAQLIDADFSEASVGFVLFRVADLSMAKGLEWVDHFGPSSVSVETLFQSKGKIPDTFLRGCGVPDSLIAYLPPLVGAENGIEYYSAFISYSSKDEEFAHRLHSRLQADSVRVWFAPEALRIGDKFRVAIDEAIRVYDKLMVVLSATSVESDWVEKEVETAMEKERQEKRAVLFPIRLDDAVMEVKAGWAADIRRTRHLGDFRNWKNVWPRAGQGTAVRCGMKTSRGRRAMAWANRSVRGTQLPTSVGSLRPYMRPSKRISPIIISGCAAKYSFTGMVSPSELVISPIAFHAGPDGSSPGCRLRRITMSVVTSVLAFRLKASLGRRTAPSRSA